MNQADTAWMLCSTALVLLMTPMLAFFYGGLVRSKNALNTMMMSFIALGFTGILLARVRVRSCCRRRQPMVWAFADPFFEGRRPRAARHDPAHAAHVVSSDV